MEDGSYMQKGHLAWLKQRHGHQEARLGESQNDEEQCRQGGILADILERLLGQHCE